MRKNTGSGFRLRWLQPRPPSKNRAHVTFDALPHSMLFLLGQDRLAPLPVTSQHLLSKSYPDPPEGRSYSQLRQRCRDLHMKELKERAPDMSRYPYPASLKSHSSMGLNKFDTGRLHG